MLARRQNVNCTNWCHSVNKWLNPYSSLWLNEVWMGLRFIVLAQNGDFPPCHVYKQHSYLLKQWFCCCRAEWKGHEGPVFIRWRLCVGLGSHGAFSHSWLTDQFAHRSMILTCVLYTIKKRRITIMHTPTLSNHSTVNHIFISYACLH